MTTKDKILSVVVSHIKQGKINQLSTSQIAIEARYMSILRVNMK